MTDIRKRSPEVREIAAAIQRCLTVLNPIASSAAVVESSALRDLLWPTMDLMGVIQARCAARREMPLNFAPGKRAAARSEVVAS